MIFTLSCIGLIILAVLGILKYKNELIQLLPNRLASSLRQYAPVHSFEAAMEQGFSSSSFNLQGNLAGDSRTGLDERSLTEIRRIMDGMGVDFDEARLIRTNRIFKENGVDEFGFPNDPKAITSLS